MWTALWAVYIIWGSTYLFIAIAGETIPPMLAVSTRFIAAAVIMAAIVLGAAARFARSRRRVGSCALIGALLPGANAVLFFAERDIPTGIASLIIASVPALGRAAAARRGRAAAGATLAGVGVGFIGVAVLLRPSGGATALGVGLCLLSAVMWAVGSFASARLTMPEDPFTATT